MPLPSLHPSLPQNPNNNNNNSMASTSTYFSSGAGRAVGSTLGSGPGSGAGGGVNRETLKGLQDVVWSDDEVSQSFVAVLSIAPFASHS
jgi:CCR4-NOT transcription complex subunit 4